MAVAWVAAGCKPKSSQDKLRAAIATGRLDNVEKALAEGGKLEDGFGEGQTALHVLAQVRMGEPGDVAKFLLEQGIDPAAKDDEGRTAWDVAFERKGDLFDKQAPTLTALLEAGFVPRSSELPDGRTALHEVAARVESSRVVDLLVKKVGLDPNARDDNGWTPLHYAVLEQNVPATTALLSNGADANAETKKTVGLETGAGARRRWSWRYEAGSRPMDVREQTRRRFDGDVLEVVKDHGGTSNEAVDNVPR